MRKRKTIATQCDCCGGIIYYGDNIDIFRHSVAQYEGSISDFSSEKMNRGDAVKHICSRCGELFTDVDVIRNEAAKAFDIELRCNPSPFKWECDQCGTELRRGHSWLTFDIVSVQIGLGTSNAPIYQNKRDDCLLELCATCATKIGTEEARAACHNMIAAVANDTCTVESDHDEDLFRVEKIVREHTAPVDPEKLAEAGIVTREHLKGRFFRVDIDWCSSGIWETDKPCLVGGMGCNLGYDEFELPEWLLQRFLFWEHWHNQFSPMDNLPIDFDWESFSAYGRSLAIDLKYHLGPDISVCYRDKEVTLGPIFRNPMVREQHELVKIIDIGAEGGRITLYGWKDGGEWWFRPEVNEMALDDEDVAELALWNKTGSVRGWEKALEILARYPWPYLYPHYVHPEFAGLVMDEVNRAAEEDEDGTCIRIEKWADVCAGKIENW